MNKVRIGLGIMALLLCCGIENVRDLLTIGTIAVILLLPEIRKEI